MIYTIALCIVLSGICGWLIADVVDEVGWWKAFFIVFFVAINAMAFRIMWGLILA